MIRASNAYWPALAAVVLVAAALMFFADLGGMALTDRDEGEYGAAVNEMRRSGDYIVPTLNGNRYLEKPILAFWAIAGAEAVAGRGELAARLPSAISAMAVVLMVAAMAWFASGSVPLAVCSAGACAFTPLYVLVARACLTDMLLTLWTTMAIMAFFMATETAKPKDLKWWLLAWAGLGLSFLTKGPVGPAVVLPTAFIYALVQRNLWQIIKRARIHWGLLIVVIINLPWYGLVFMRLGSQFWQDFFVSQNIRRFSEVLLGHGGGLAYYIPVLLLGAFPFFIVALPALGRALAKNPRLVRAADPLARLRMLSAIAVLVVFVVFSLAATKQINYILPALPFVALLAGYKLWRMASGEIHGKLDSHVFWGGFILLAVILGVALAAILGGLPAFWDKILDSIRFDSSEYALPHRAPVLLLWPALILTALAATVAVARIVWLKGKKNFMPCALMIGAALCCAALFFGLLPQIAAEINEPAKRLTTAAVQKAGGDKIVSYGLWKPSVIYYADRVVPRFRVEQGDKLAQLLAGPEPVWVTSRARLADKLAHLPGFVKLAREKGYLLGGNQAAAAKWQTGKEQEAQGGSKDP